MKRIAASLLLLGSIVGSPVLVGCDRTISEEKTVEQKSDGTVVKKEDKVVEKADGTVERTQEKKVEH